MLYYYYILYNLVHTSDTITHLIAMPWYTLLHMHMPWYKSCMPWLHTFYTLVHTTMPGWKDWRGAHRCDSHIIKKRTGCKEKTHRLQENSIESNTVNKWQVYMLIVNRSTFSLRCKSDVRFSEKIQNLPQNCCFLILKHH